MKHRMRLHEITEEEFKDMCQSKLMAGQREYGETHLERYNLLDVLEEIADSINILNLFADRMSKEASFRLPLDISLDKAYLMTQVIETKEFKDLEDNLLKSVSLINDLDKIIDDKFCTDDLGGQRDYFGKVNRTFTK